MSSQSAITSAVQFPPSLPPQLLEDDCPSCGQSIPPEKMEEMKGRIAAKERETRLSITSTMEARFQQERAADEGRHRQQLAEWQQSLSTATEARKAAEENNVSLNEKLLQITRDTAKSIESAKSEGRREAEEQTETKLAELQKAHTASELALQERLSTAEAATAEAREATQKAVDAAVAEKLTEVQNANAAANAVLEDRVTRAEAATVEAHALTQKTVDAAVAEKLTEVQNANAAANAVLEDRVVKAEAATAEAHAGTQKAIDAAVAEKVTEAQKANATTNAMLEERATRADGRAAEAQQKLLAAKSEHTTAVAKQLQDLREIMEKATADALGEQAASHFSENQRLTKKVDDLTRDLARRSNEDLGEGAELKLYEALRAEFHDDEITEVPRGAKGADIIHVIIHQGKPCGKIVYDSKNHKQWRTEHASKLRVDQLAVDAEHAILSTHSFPAGAKQLQLHEEGVILANPARVIQVAGLLRRHSVLLHTLKVSAVERNSKKEALYNFINSEHSSSLLQRVDSKAQMLLDIQVEEKQRHETTWKKQGNALREIQKAKADLENAIYLIVGTTEQEDELALEAEA